ncbi:hypothetical protein K488DRAFT_90298 [Vararia minispora EC-137]|uniref:Uncharacterized protein n=1 Tax=Vararia minispora EC-137 TaxID=1314806 RepID=A0ACB8Q8S6_9AGAM|nr:hypothetical protein K488DRAFT_90298 [Vararia minispora EC-137]
MAAVPFMPPAPPESDSAPCPLRVRRRNALTPTDALVARAAGIAFMRAAAQKQKRERRAKRLSADDVLLAAAVAHARLSLTIPGGGERNQSHLCRTSVASAPLLYTGPLHLFSLLHHSRCLLYNPPPIVSFPASSPPHISSPFVLANTLILDYRLCA